MNQPRVLPQSSLVPKHHLDTGNYLLTGERFGDVILDTELAVAFHDIFRFAFCGD